MNTGEIMMSILKTNIPLSSLSLIGALGIMAVLATPSAQAGQARVTGAALVDDDSNVSAVAGEAIFAPGRLLGDDLDFVGQVSPEIEELTDSVGDAVTGLDLNYRLAFDNGPVFRSPLEEVIAETVNDAGFDRESDIISLVKNFGGVSSPLGQAQVTGAAAFDTDNTVSAIAGQTELARGQTLADGAGIINPSVDIETERINDDEILDNLDIDFSTGRPSINLLEEAIAETVNDAGFDRESDVISLVKAFTEESEGAVSSEEVVSAGFE